MKIGFEIPEKIKKLKRNGEGYPIPWFVAWIGGKPDFRIVEASKFPEAINRKLCWICGEPLGRYVAFVIGPMCAINETSSEPPSHKECAIFAAKVCPFLANPNRERRETNIPEGTKDPAGISLRRNPGVTLVWITTSYKPFKAGNGVLIEMGDPVDTFWFCKSRKATREEITDSISSGLPHLIKLANEESQEAVDELHRRIIKAMKLVPAS